MRWFEIRNIRIDSKVMKITLDCQNNLWYLKKKKTSGTERLLKKTSIIHTEMCLVARIIVKYYGLSYTRTDRRRREVLKEELPLKILLTRIRHTRDSVKSDWQVRLSSKKNMAHNIKKKKKKNWLLIAGRTTSISYCPIL